MNIRNLKNSLVIIKMEKVYVKPKELESKMNAKINIYNIFKYQSISLSMISIDVSWFKE